MPKRYLKSIGAYLPLLRLERKEAAAALGWSGLGGPKAGRRSVAGWDEDALTMAIEAARGTVASNLPWSVVFASTSAPFRERLQGSVLCEALGLSGNVSAADVAGSRRCAVSALRRALIEGQGDTLIAAGEKRHTAPGSSLQLAWGDGAAAALVSDEGFAELIGEATLNADLVDIYVSEDRRAPYQSEERFIRDEAVGMVLAPAIRGACDKAGIEPAEIAFAAVHEPVAGTWKLLAGAVGLKAPNLCEEVATAAGDLGSAHALFGLALASERAKPGDIVLVAGFGSGADVLLFRMTSAPPMAGSASDALTRGVSTANYMRFLSLAGALSLDWGPRSEVDPKTAASVLARHGRDMHGFVGGRDSRGNVQFPKTLVPVSPDATGPEQLEDVPLADVPARIVSIATDRLNFTPDPPFYFGLVQFDNGARVAMELRDVEASVPKVGDSLRMRFRIKSIDRKRGFRTYFWKAAPAERPLLETV